MATSAIFGYAATFEKSLGLSRRVPDTYFGLTRAEAEALARRERRSLVDRSPEFHARRKNLVSNRVNVLFDEHGVVIDADIG